MVMDSIAQQLVDALTQRNLTITTAESCTGGMIASAITDISGASAVLKQGVITYANEAKSNLLGVRPDTLENYGAVSEETAWEMAEGAREKSGADIAIALTGIAGPTGGTEAKPVGLVYIGVSTVHEAAVQRFVFTGTRHTIRTQAVHEALALALASLTRFGNTPT